MLRRLALVFLTIGALTACDRVMEMTRGAAPIDDSGAYVVLELDMAAAARERLTLASEDMAAALRGATPSIRYTGRGVVGDAARIRLIEPAAAERALQALQPLADVLIFSHDGTGLIEARLTPASIGANKDRLLAESVAVLQRRAEGYRLSVERSGDARIIVRSAGAAFPEEARAALTTNAQLTFHLVREVSPEEAAAGRVPPGTMVVQPYPGVGSAIEVVAERPSINGARLETARASTDPYTGEFVLTFTLDREGTRQFCRITTERTNQRFAVLLDNQVLTAPTINEPICGGSGQIAGNFTAQSASDFVTMLSAGGLPAPVTIVAEGVGPLPATP